MYVTRSGYIVEAHDPNRVVKRVSASEVDLPNDANIVYRVLRSSEKPSQGLYAEAYTAPGEAKISIAEAIETGSRVCSPYLHTTRNFRAPRSR